MTVQPLRVAVAAIISPKGTLESYRPLVAYLGARLGRPGELVQRRTYAETNELVRRGEVDVAFVCTRAYVMGRREFGMQLLAIPEVHGQQVYYSVVIVRADSPFRRVEDLRGATFAFTDPLSNTGHLYPVYLVYRMGYRPEEFFKQTFFTYSHDNAIRAVDRGDVYIDPGMAKALLEDLVSPQAGPDLTDPWESLSEREQQVLRGVALGYTNREIAERLHLSVKTVETYRARAMEKLGLATRAQLVQYAARRGLLEGEWP